VGGGGLDSSRLHVVEIARVPDVLPSLFPSFLVGLTTYQHPVLYCVVLFVIYEGNIYFWLTFYMNSLYRHSVRIDVGSFISWRHLGIPKERGSAACYVERYHSFCTASSLHASAVLIDRMT